MRRSIRTTGQRLATVLALATLTLLSALPTSARPDPGTPVVPADTDPVSTAQTASTGIPMTVVLAGLVVVVALTAIAYLAGAARQRRTLAHGV